MKIPNTPFSTRLSGSAKETELRIRNIFQWKKNRPPVIVLVLVVVLLLGICGGLIGFSSSPRNGTISELYPKYFAENSVRKVWYEDKEAYVPGALEFGSENFAAAMEFFGTMELRAVTGQNKYIGEFDRRNGAFYLEGEQDVPLKVEFYPDGYVVISTGRGPTEGHKDAKVYRAEAFDKEVFLGYWGTGDAQQYQPARAVYELFGEDGITLTLHLADQGGQNAYEITQLSYAERFAVLMSGYEWSLLEMPLTEPSEFHLTAKSLDGERTMTFWSGSAAMIQYNGSENTTYWKGTPISPEATSIAEDIRRIYNMFDAASSRVMFRGEGTAWDAANVFVHSEYEKHLTSLAPGSPYAVSEYAVVRWLVREVSADGLAVTGDFEYAFVPVVPDVVEIWAGNTSQGTGEYAGMLTAYRQFTLQKQADGYWHCIDLGTGGSQLSEPLQTEEPTPDESEHTQVELHGLTLDETGREDDSIVLTNYRVVDGKLTGKVTLVVTLGNGETLAQNFDGNFWSPYIQGAYLTSTDHQSAIVELPAYGSTYGGAQYYILEVVNDALEVFDLNTFYDERSLLDGYQIVSRPDSELSCVRIPISAGTKWNNTGWGSLTWDNGQWNFTEDGYFIDTRTLTVDGGMELTLALRGRDDDYGSNGYLYYDQIQILHGSTVIQTITEDSFTPDNHCPFEYFNADASFHAVLTEDINFDGNTDFGIPCNDTHNDGHVWFLYDPQSRQYRFAFSLAGIPTIDKGNKQIIEEWWDDSVYITYNTYEFNVGGQLILIESQKESERASNSASGWELLRSVLTGSEFISADSGKTFTLNQLRQSGFSADDAYPAIPEKFAVVDMDHDGAAEVVLQLKVGAIIKYLILRVQAGEVFGYTRGVRSLMDLKIDGTFEWSSGAFDCGSASIRFEEYFYTFNGNTYREPCTVDKISYCDSYSDPGGNELFFVNSQPATADEFNVALAEQQAKPGVPWYDLTDENIKIFFAD